MKTILTILVVVLIAGIVYLWLNPKEKKIEVPHIEYKDSPIVDSLKKESTILTVKVKVLRDSLKNYTFKKIIVAGKPVYQLKDTFVHDTVYLLQNDIINFQDSLLMTKDSIIFHLTTDLKLKNDSLYYFKALFIDEKTKKKKWKIAAISSAVLNILMFLRK